MSFNRKGIVLAGGMGSRLYPATRSISKQLLPVYDKPMIYYPLCTLMQAGIQDILVITTPRDRFAFQDLLGTGQLWGLNIQYAEQLHPRGIAEALIIGADFIGYDPVTLILGDNIFYGSDLHQRLARVSRNTGATVFAYEVNDPQRYGVVTFDDHGVAYSLEEKPKEPLSRWAVTGLYFYDPDVVEFARNLKPSSRGELEITDLNMGYLNEEELYVEKLGRGYAWLDTGTCESLLEASQFVATIQRRTGFMLACPEEIAFRNEWITRAELLSQANRFFKSSEYGKYLTDIGEGKIE